ncbi:DUF2586 family protein [Empedobacter sp. UBA7248]|uniref:DUF2586 family protein n=1 Tax=Empedobacter sp. UBA7248 TaxID=1946448 RepID=UPI0025C20061|nr:DUF2586 family protein [Empedobacter sp. UBA7248]
MSNLNGITIQKGKLGVSRRNNKRSVSALIISSAVLAELAYNTPITIYSTEDLEQYGLTTEFDTTNNVHVFRHVSEFYRMAGVGTELHLMLVPQTETLKTILQSEGAKTLLASADFEIRQLAIAVNPTAAPTLVKGLPEDLLESISLAQGLADWALKQNMPCHIFLEGNHLDGASNAVENLREIENVQATKVSVVIGQDWKYAETKTGLAQKFADVGTVLGVCSAASIEQNIGDNEAFDINDARKDAWMIPGLSSHKKNTEVYSQLQTFEDKGYIFGLSYSGLAGIRINNDHVCAPVVVDQEGNMNEHTIAYGRIMDDAIRQLRSVYLPKIKKTYPVDENGKLLPGSLVSLEGVGDKVFEDMVASGEISYGKTTIDSTSDLLVEKELIVSFTIVPMGSIGEIKGTINIKNNI